MSTLSTLKLSLTFVFLSLFFHSKAQLPACTGNRMLYTMTSSGIYNIDLSQPVPTAVLNTIPLPAGASGLAVSPNLNAATPAITFYTIVNGFYWYYDGTSWVSTTHTAGGGVNIGAGGGYIYNYDVIGTVTRYDGTGNAVQLPLVINSGGVADLSVECSGNFYYLHNPAPQTLTKYSPSGAVLNVYTVVGAPVSIGGGGLAVFGNDVYYDDLSASGSFPPLLHGVISGNTVTFSPTGFSIQFASDMASCAGNTITVPPLDVSICDNQLPYNWNGQNLTLPGTYTGTFTSTSGCDSNVTINLTINQSPQAPQVVSPVSFCQLQTAQPLSAVATGSLLWYTSSSGGTGSAVPPIPPTTNAGVVNYYVSQSVAGCESQRALLTVNVLASPVPQADKAVTICNGKSTDLASLYNSAGNTTTKWFFNQVPVIDPTSVSIAGTYQYIATNLSGCADTAFVNLAIQPQVMAFAGNDDSTEIGIPYQLSGSGGLQYEWSPGIPLLNDDKIPNPIATLIATTTFSLIVKDEMGCEGYDTVTIKAYRGIDIFVPSAFTPNGDGLNDILRPLGTAIERLDYFRVYNRYGEIIFQTKDPTKGWDGTYKGKPQNTGNYIWVLKALDRKKVQRAMKGYVILIR